MSYTTGSDVQGKIEISVSSRILGFLVWCAIIFKIGEYGHAIIRFPSCMI